MSVIKFEDAFNVFTKTIRGDEGLYIAYKSNIAMSFYDACKNAGYEFPELSKLANIGAENFLKLLFLQSSVRSEERDCDSCEHDGECCVTMLQCKGYKPVATTQAKAEEAGRCSFCGK